MYGIPFRVEANPGKFQELVDFMTWDAEVCRVRLFSGRGEE